MSSIRTTLAGLGTAAVLATLVAPVASAAPASRERPWGACVEGSVCFYAAPDGRGHKCAFMIADKDWTQGSVTCDWSRRENVRSVWNRGTSSAKGVAYYKWRNYNTRMGCTRQGHRGNLSGGGYKLKSHRWINGACG